MLEFYKVMKHNFHLFMVPASRRVYYWDKAKRHQRDQNDLHHCPFAGILHVSPLNTCAQACQL